MSASGRPAPKGRGSHINPPNRFDSTRVEPDFDELDEDDHPAAGLGRPVTEYLSDQSQSIITQNDSPDVGFRYSLNPYRGCSHGCSYCYAKPTHEYLGLSAGLDFETKILVKHDAPQLLRRFLARDGWTPQPIMLSGVTDCYQPAERELGLTRGCLEVAWEARQPVAIITKNALVVRDLDLLGEMAALRLVHVSLSVTTLDPALARTMEPRTSSPEAKLRAMRALADAGVPVRVMVAPVIPALTESEIPAILAAAAQAGARAAGYVLLRLPLSVKPVFLEWLARTQPSSRARIEAMIRATREGKLNSSKFGERMRGSGPIARQIADLFRLFAKRYALDGPLPALDCGRFRPPRPESGQLRLF